MSPKRLYIFTLISASILILVMSFLFYLGNKLLVERSSLVEAAAEIKLNATTAHLWFEEIMSGDRGESITVVWGNIDTADWYATVMLEGGKSDEGEFYPLQDPEMRQSIILVRQDLAKFKKIAEKRYQNLAASIPGTDIDIQFDKIFRIFIKQADSVELQVKRQIAEEVVKYRFISFFLITISALISLFLSNYLYKREKHRVDLVDSLTEATISIEVKNRELHKLAHYDSLTGLPNRILFLDRLDQAIIHAMRTRTSVAILFIDLDHFKAVNDQYGHQLGDELLKQVSKRLKECIRADDSAARVSGDEFVIILKGLDDVNSALETANKVAESLVNQMQKPFQFEGPVVYVSASIGVSIYPVDSTNGEELTSYADDAMYHAKSLGKNNFQFYSDELNRQSKFKLETEQDLRIALEEDQFVLHYHPQWQLKTSNISGLEVLVRWSHPHRGLVYPDDFIPVAESCGLIQKLDLLIAEKALKQYKEWQESGYNFGVMAINVSPVCFRRPDFFQNISQIINQSGVETKNIELELTESVLVENDKHSQKVLTDLKNLGIRVAIDDFGTGFSSMAYLKNFKVDTLKIDRSFVADFNKNNTSKVILKNMVTLGIELGLSVVSEGVETEEQEQFLKNLGCNIAQGYLLTKPLPSDKLTQFLLALKSENVFSIQQLESI